MEFPIRTRISEVEMGKYRQRREERRKRRKTQALFYLHQKLPTRGKYILFLSITPTVHLHRKKKKIKQSKKQRQIIRVFFFGVWKIISVKPFKEKSQKSQKLKAYKKKRKKPSKLRESSHLHLHKLLINS